ncbi:unnamed protein product [Linum trigynum]|uniref:Uncharacterized protein n=1 Tax=Linum trigynum TaxID=586398 RepID=A0AAV2G5F1_9ROSI
MRETIYRELTMEFLVTFKCLYGTNQDFNFDEEDTVTFRLGGVMTSTSVTSFSVALSIYCEEFNGTQSYRYLKRK